MTSESWSVKTPDDQEAIRAVFAPFSLSEPSSFTSVSSAQEPAYIFEPSYDPSSSPNSANAALNVSPSNYLVPNVGRLKVFVGGLPQNATVDEMRSHFGGFGEAVMEVEIKMDKITGRSRGFGFVTICNCDSTRLFNAIHRISGKVVDVAEVTETKLFVGGLRPQTTKDLVVDYFQRFGTVVNCEVMTDSGKPGNSRGFAFVVFETAEAAGAALAEPAHFLDERKVDVRKAEPRKKLAGRVGGREGLTISSAPLHQSYIASPQPSPVFTPSFAPSYGAFGGYGEFEPGPPPAPPHLPYGALGAPSSYGFPGPVPGYDLIPGVGTSNRFHPF